MVLAYNKDNGIDNIPQKNDFINYFVGSEDFYLYVKCNTQGWL